MKKTRTAIWSAAHEKETRGFAQGSQCSRLDVELEISRPSVDHPFLALRLFPKYFFPFFFFFCFTDDVSLTNPFSYEYFGVIRISYRTIVI